MNIISIQTEKKVQAAVELVANMLVKVNLVQPYGGMAPTQLELSIVAGVKIQFLCYQNQSKAFRY